MRCPKRLGGLFRGFALLLAALALSGLWALARTCSTMGILSQPDAQAQMRQVRAWEQQAGLPRE